MSMGHHHGRNHGYNRNRPPLARRHPSLPPLKAAGDMPERGTVKFFDRSRGYGFITTSDGRDVFVHQKVVRQYGINDLILEPGTPVRFAYMKDAQRGLAADAIAVA